MHTNFKPFWLLLAAAVCPAAAQQTLHVEVSNPSSFARDAEAVVLPLSPYGGTVRSALVSCNGQEVPCQLDDLDADGTYDELCFLTDLKKKEHKKFTVQLLNSGEPRTYEPQVYAEMLLSNKKIKAANQQNLYISSLTADRGTNPYNQLHHHGPAFENRLVAYRIYFDHRQTVDIYGKRHKGLELRDTQFYPDSTQKANGYGDDVLWVGSTLGLGTLRGWDGQQPVMLEDVAHRTLRILARGPLRTVVEVIDQGWNAPSTLTPQRSPLNAQRSTLTMTTRYTLYAERRDCEVSVRFDRPAADYRFATGIIRVKGSTEFTDGHGLRGCWGTDWPVSERDSVGHQRETVGLGICVPAANVVSELPADRQNYAYVVATPTDVLRYHITFCSDNEDFGYHAADTWFAYLKEWKKRLSESVVTTVSR